MTARCGKRYGARPRRRTCRRLAGHKGPHGIRLTVAELRQVTLPRRRRR